jgi:phospholipid/cholesterol/gamma-HCH transport system substrate-binding protein
MTTLGNAGRVGLVFVAAVVLLGAMWYFLKGNILNNNTYSFDVLFTDASGATADTPVTLAGVQIGRVEAVTLTPGQQADLKLEIKNKINGRDIRIPRGSQFMIVTPVLGTSGTVMVVPPVDAAMHPRGSIRDGEADLKGDRAGDLTASLGKANALLDQVTVTTKKVDALLDSATRLANDPKIQNSLQQTLRNFNEASANVNAASANGLKLTGSLNGLLTTDNDQVLALLRQTKAGEQVSLNNLAATTGSVRQITQENRAQIAGIVHNLNDTTSAVAGITGQLNDTLKSGGITKNLSDTVANLKTTTDKLNVIAGNFQSLSTIATDPKVQSNLKDTVQNIRDTSEQAEFLIERLNKLAGGGRKSAAVIVAPGIGAVVLPSTGKNETAVTPTPAPSRGAPYYLPRVQALYNTRDKHFRTDIDVLVPLSLTPVTFVRAGIYGFGDSNKLILQGGQALGKNGLIAGRAGIYASKLSVGADIGLGKRETLSLDLYDPNNFRIDAKGTLLLTPDLGLVLGGENINRSRRSGALVGLEYRLSR